MTKISSSESYLPLPWEHGLVKAILVPSGDQAGELLAAAFRVSLVWRLPSAFMT